RQLTDEQIRSIRRGGHDPNKVYAAYKKATEYRGAPSVILAKTIKGFGMGEVGEGRMTAHQQKKLNVDILRQIRTRLGIPLSDTQVEELSFYGPPKDSPEISYLLKRRAVLGGFVPCRPTAAVTTTGPDTRLFEEFLHGTNGRAVSTTSMFVRILAKLLTDADMGRYIVPIVPDEARTFGMEALFRKYGIYSHIGQLYDPVDSESLMYYREVREGQLIEEGISEAGGLSSFIAAGTAYATHGIPTLPVFVFYSIFGFQRVGDLIYAAGDQRARGFLIGATSGRTTLNGEGLQHQDGHSHLFAYGYPHIVAYDPAFAFELAIIMREGVRRMYTENEDVIYYLTVQNEAYAMPDMADDIEASVLKGMYLFRQSTTTFGNKANLFSSGSIINEALKAQQILEEEFEVAAAVWSITSFQQLHEDGIATERWNLLHPDQPRAAWVSECLADSEGACVVASDYLKALPDSIARWFPRPPVSLGTDGFGRSESREALRRYFEIDAATIAYAALVELFRQGKLDSKAIRRARKQLDIDPDKINPLDV
ncbi:MAG TPA: pyruvate dehydrogenase (acetyl-transferring), homodimeric type, partial [Lentisphaeria bacterium]|nr:pyruvate dehydrogenase (acetyl-transferring), homodimeric type [Lentisphaeria bacterium]